MSYTKTQWQNDQEPAINAENLNKIEQGIYDAHQIAEEKVDKETGKGLSTNDYTNAEKQKVADSLSDAPSDGKQYARQDGNWEELDLDGKANIDGYYDTLSVGLADNLIDRKGNGTPQEISYRTSCGDDSIADDGNGIIQSIFGKTVVWNQYMNKSLYFSTYTSDTVTMTNNGDGSITIVVSAPPSSKVRKVFQSKVVEIPYGHKVFMMGGISSAIQLYDSYTGTATRESGDGVIYTVSYSGGREQPEVNVNTSCTAGTYKVTPRLFDLTQLFGSGNEPSTVDDPRIEWIKQYASAHPEYNSGELISYNGSGIKTVGFNQWDEEWENGWIDNTGGNRSSTTHYRSKNYIRVFPNTIYYFKNASDGTTNAIRVSYYDENKNYIGNVDANNIGNVESLGATRKTHNNCYYIRFWREGATYNNDICINFSWSGYRNGEYEPYWTRTLDLPISTYFPDGMKSAVSVRDEMAKDKAVKRIGKVDLGSLEWEYNTSGYFATNSITDMQKTKQYECGGICGKYEWVSPTTTSELKDKQMCRTVNLASRIFVKDSAYTDAQSFKSAMSGVYLYYELAEPIETTITPPLDLTYKVADFGTEESIAEGKSTPFNGIVKYSDDFTRGLVNMPKNYDTTASLDALATSLSTMLTSALDGTVTITRGAYDSTNKKYAWNCTFTPNA